MRDLVTLWSTHWNTHEPARDWTTMFQDSLVVGDETLKKKTVVPDLSLSDMTYQSLCALTNYHLNQCRIHWFPRHGVTAAISTIVSSLCRIQCPEQARVWATIDHEWINMCQHASGQRSWMLFLVTLWGMLLSHPPFVSRSINDGFG